MKLSLVGGFVSISIATSVAAAAFHSWKASGANATDNAQQLAIAVPHRLKTVIVQLFQWNWDSVAQECEEFIGPAGYGFVQVSPPQEHVQGPEWYTDYQPVSYILTSKRGNRSQFEDMITQCHAAGVGVIADTIFNHMSGRDSGTGVAGSTFTYYNYPGIYQFQDFHHCGLDEIRDWNNRWEVQTCPLLHLADLATNTNYVQHRLAEYANDLLSLGVDGLRLDAAKHIAAEEIRAILDLLSHQPYITQETVSGGPIQPSEYVGNGDVQEFRYSWALKDAFLNGGNGGISNLRNLENKGWVSGNQVNVFVANHDQERDDSSLNANSPSNTYILATIFSLAHPYGTPTVLSSYSYSNIKDGAPNGGAGTCSETGGAKGWLCQHRYVAFSGMVGFRNNVGPAAVSDWVSPQPDRIAFGRGSFGYVVINNNNVAWTATFSTSLPDGEYCDVVGGKSSNCSCTSKTVAVSGGSFNATVNPRDALAIHTDAQGMGPTAVTVTFIERTKTSLGENIFIVGSIPELGSWSPSSSVPLSAAHYPNWSVELFLQPGATLEYKFIRKETDGTVVWESGPNRRVTVALSGSQNVSTSWR